MRRLAVVALGVVAAGALASATAQAQTLVPRALEDWQAWVLKGNEFHRCPFLAGSNPGEARSYRCAWPERLLLNVDAHGATFTQRWQVYTDSWVALPGDLVRWPEGVLVDGRAAAVVAREGVPQLRLAAGHGRRVAVRDALARRLARRISGCALAVQPAAVRARGSHAPCRDEPRVLGRALRSPGFPRHGRDRTRVG